MDPVDPLLIKLSEHLAARRHAILDALRREAVADPAQTTVTSLSRVQFLDHLPSVLEAFERNLRSRPGGQDAATAEEDQTAGEIKHGLHRWQQGYRLAEVTREWGHLHGCLFEELVAFAAAHSESSAATMLVAHRELMQMIHAAITESTTQYAQMQQAEAAGRARDLQLALDQIQVLEQRRTDLIHQAVHDLRGNVQAMSTTAEVLRESDLSTGERAEFVDLLQQGTAAVGTMLAELMDLARLEAGHEIRSVAPFDAAALLQEFAGVTATLAADRGLFLKTAGPVALPVHGDAGKVRRLLQNLVLNALKYTERGGVTLSWGEGTAGKWWFLVEDTGPGLRFGAGAPLLDAMNQATTSARETDGSTLTTEGDDSREVTLGVSRAGSVRPSGPQPPGEGIGLSIVKRLCELLDASLELASSEQSGTAFRIVLPRQYPS